jgi:membrane protein implicated in regulation of membrane protease activity
MRKYLAEVPYLRRLMLQPLDSRDVHEREQRESLVDLDYLVNKTGIATTPLRPAGKARFGDDVVDVTCEREAIDRGESLSVSRIQGNKVIVRRLNRA